ncbi:modD protein [Chloroherpeton thalassium ATCC 35110]|uniref:Putative pyrophosphorylase ModD n=1 Tax=Chloroherpeton thalassium (strain ATCC 35110 / GB-78) TaxID=517418 RepID=B3QXM9_CHLT3|nr:ModD protein [Chloroherpeton thalassium]ACF14944.1 modD protein [Chloroherpeton thalassium ATCC 35110]
MTVFISDEEISKFIQEDVPYFDLTTLALGIAEKKGKITYHTRHETVACGTEEAARVLEKCGAKVTTLVPSGSLLSDGELMLEAEGAAGTLHTAWKVSLNLLEYMSGVATRTNKLVTLARRENPNITVAITRKIFPGTKSLSVKAVLAGGAHLHRLGLSETVLVFKQHLVFMGGLSEFLHQLEALKIECKEKKIGIEVDNEAQAFEVAEAGVDMVQFDKIPANDLTKTVSNLKAKYPSLQIAAAGGINGENVREYAATGVDILVTTWPYFGKPADIQAKMHTLDIVV